MSAFVCKLSGTNDESRWDLERLEEQWADDKLRCSTGSIVDCSEQLVIAVNLGLVGPPRLMVGETDGRDGPTYLCGL